ncbi:MAG: ATP-binding protein [Bacteroidales bacterium]|nr:ATP-binding protein [Bacteroidales bacterium]
MKFKMDNSSKDSIKKEFHDYYLHSYLSTVRIGLIITILLFVVFTIIDLFFIREHTSVGFFLRFSLILPILLFSVIISSIKACYKYLNTIFIILNLCSCVVIFWVGCSSEITSPGYEYYFSWVMLMVIGFFTFYRLQIHSLLIIGALQVFAYLLATMWNGAFATNPSQAIDNLFFIIAIYSLGSLMSFLLQNINWKNFLHQKSMLESYRHLLQESKTREIAEKDLRSSEAQIHDILDAIPDWIYVLDEQRRFVMLNSALKTEHLRQGYKEDCIGKKITKVYPLISKKALDEFDTIFRTGKILSGEQFFELIDKKIYGETRKVPVFKDQKVIQVISILRDRSREQEIKELKAKNIEQKEIMLREIHHRVKNNMAIVISLLTLQMQNSNNPEFRESIKEIEMRIRSMALIHEHLYRSEDLGQIPLDNYLYSLSSIISQTYRGPQIQLVPTLDSVHVNIDTALPLGLITNELLTNAFKYAFPGNTPGTIELKLKKKPNDNYLLVIKDDGTGLPAGFTMESDKSMGMFIVKLLVDQLDGKIEIIDGKGTTFMIYFREQISMKPN